MMLDIFDFTAYCILNIFPTTDSEHMFIEFNPFINIENVSIPSMFYSNDIVDSASKKNTLTIAIHISDIFMIFNMSFSAHLNFNGIEYDVVIPIQNIVTIEIKDKIKILRGKLLTDINLETILSILSNMNKNIDTAGVHDTTIIDFKDIKDKC